MIDFQHISILLGLWILFYLQHSVMARVWFQQGAEKYWPDSTRYFRIIYNILSVILFSFAGLYTVIYPGELLFERKEIWQFTGLMLATYGVIIGRKGIKNYNMGLFSGFSQLKGKPDDEPFSTEGILRRVRHPLYTATLLLIVGFWLFIPGVNISIACISMIIYLFIGIFFEEKKLIKIYGKRYENYRKEVPMLIPKFWNK